MMVHSREIILALGSNSEQEASMVKARTLLMALLQHVSFSENVCTEPIGIQSPHFLNCLAVATTSMCLTDLVAALKKVEHLCGDTVEQRRMNVVRMDIDILKYDTERLHEKDWERQYVLDMLRQLKPELVDNPLP